MTELTIKYFKGKESLNISDLDENFEKYDNRIKSFLHGDAAALEITKNNETYKISKQSHEKEESYLVQNKNFKINVALSDLEEVDVMNVVKEIESYHSPLSLEEIMMEGSQIKNKELAVQKLNSHAGNITKGAFLGADVGLGPVPGAGVVGAILSAGILKSCFNDKIFDKVSLNEREGERSDHKFSFPSEDTQLSLTRNLKQWSL